MGPLFGTVELVSIDLVGSWQGWPVVGIVVGVGVELYWHMFFLSGHLSLNV
jgi:hypothetical protein